MKQICHHHKISMVNLLFPKYQIDLLQRSELFLILSEKSGMQSSMFLNNSLRLIPYRHCRYYKKICRSHDECINFKVLITQKYYLITES